MALNISAATALVIAPSTTPYTITLDARQTAQPNHEVWWRYTAGDCMSAIVIIAHAVSGTTYQPTVAVFTGTPDALTGYPDSAEHVARTQDYTLATTPGTTYYIRVRSAAQNNDLDSDLSFYVGMVSNTTVAPTGTLAFTYASGRPFELRSSATGAVIQVVSPFEHALFGTTLNDGTVLVNTNNSPTADLYDAHYQHLLTVPYPGFQISSNGRDRFYIANFVGTLAATPVVRAIAANGALLNTWTLPDDYTVDTGPVGFYGLAPSPDDSILYIGGPPIGYAGDDPVPSGVVRRFDLGSGTYLSDLGDPLDTSPHVYVSGIDILVLADGSVIVPYQRQVLGVNTTIVLRYASDGTLLNTYTLGDGHPHHLARIPGDDSAFWVHTTSEGGVGTAPDRLRKVRVSDGAILTNFTIISTQTPLEFQGGAFWVSAVSRAACVPPVGSPSPAPPTPLPPIPQPPPTTPNTPCTPHTQTGNGGGGNSGCNTGGLGYVPSYAGPWGSVPQHPDPVPGESMINAKGVDLWVEIVHTDYPGGNQVTYRRAMVDLADPPEYQGGRKAGGLLGVGDVEHGLGNEQGGFEAATVDIAYADSADRLFRNLLSDQELEGDEVRIKLATEHGRLTAVAPRVLARAVAQKPRLSSDLNASFSAADFLFSEFGPFGPGRQFPSWLVPEGVFKYASIDSLKLPLPVLYGEKSDEGAVDPLTGVVNAKGLVPLIYVGPAHLDTTGQVSTFPTSDPNLTPPPDSEVLYLVHPAGELSFQAVQEHSTLDRYDAKLYARGTTVPVLSTFSLGLPTPDANGTIRVNLKTWLSTQPAGDYDVTVTAVRGMQSEESGFSNPFTVPLAPESGAGGWGGPVDSDPFFAVMAVYNNRGSRLVLKTGVSQTYPYDPTPHDFRVTWTEAPQAAEYWVFMYSAGSLWDAYNNPYAHATVRYKRVPATPTNSRDPDWDYFSDWTSPNDGTLWPPAEGTTSTHPDVWDTYVLAGHAIFDVLSVYGSDLGHGDADAEQQRIRIDPGTRGDILCPFFSTWPFPTTYRDFTAEDGTVYRLTVIYARGPLSDAHKNGVINLTVNAIGVEDVGDGSGLPLTDAHAVQQHWIENFLLRNYRAGLWATSVDYPQWNDGTPMVRSSSFATLQAMGKSRIGDRGLTVGWYAGDQKALQDWFMEWNRSTDSRLGINGDGQIMVMGLDEALDTTNWPRIHHETDLFGDVVLTSGEERENVVSGVCDWDPDKKQFRGQTFEYVSQRAISKYKNRRKAGNKVESTVLVSERQMRWVLLRRLTRLQNGSKTVEITGKIDLLDYDVGTGILLTTTEGTGEQGFVDKPLLILRRHFKVADRLVTLTLLDLDTFLVPLEQQFVIGDDTISLPTGPVVGGGGGGTGGGGGGGTGGGGGGTGGGGGSTTATFFSSGWERSPTTGSGGDPPSSNAVLTDNFYITNDYGPADAGSTGIVEVTTDEHNSGTRSLQFNYPSGYGTNGPDFRIGFSFEDFGKGELQTVYFRWYVKFSSNFYFKADHKQIICGVGPPTFSQRIYINTRPLDGDPTTGTIAMFNEGPSSLGFVSTMPITRNEWHRIEARVTAGTHGSVRVLLDGVEVTWDPDASTPGANPLDMDTGPSIGWVKHDSTFNSYDDTAVQAATPFYEWRDDWAVSDVNWIGAVGSGGGGGGGGGGVQVGLPIVPFAFGYGMQTRAAWGGGSDPTICLVTTTADNGGSNTLRHFLEDVTGPRVILFETSGPIDLNDSDISIHDPYVYVAGQTAPSPGISIIGGGITVYTHNVVFSHIRLRPGDGGETIPQTQGHDGALAYSFFGPVTNIIYDHCSISWCGGKNTQVQTGSQGPVGLTYWRCIISEALYRARNVIVNLDNGDPSSLGMLMANNANQVSILQNLFAHNAARNPEIHEDNFLHFINNVIYDWGKGGDRPQNYYRWASLFYSPVAGPWFVDMIGNRYIAGPPPYPDSPIIAIGTYAGDAGSQVYLNDNTVDEGRYPVTLFENYMGFDPRVSTPPVPLDGLTIMPSTSVEAFVLTNAGARPFDRDAVDSRIVSEVYNRTGGMISSQDQVGGFPSLAVNTRTLDVPDDPHAVMASGYTRLEEWIHAYSAIVEGLTSDFVVGS